MVYNYKDYIEKRGTRIVPLNGKHRFSECESACNSILLRRIELRSKREVYYPN